MDFNEDNLGHHLSCLMGRKFHASGEREDFNIFLCISMVQTQDTPGSIHFGLCGHHLNKLDLTPQGNAAYQI